MSVELLRLDVDSQLFCLDSEERWSTSFNFIYRTIIFPYPPPSMQISICWTLPQCGFSLAVDALLSPSAETSVWTGQRKLGYMYQHAKHIQRHKGKTVKKHNGRNYNVCKWGGNKDSILLSAACQLRRAHRRLASHRHSSSRAAVTSKHLPVLKVSD